MRKRTFNATTAVTAAIVVACLALTFAIGSLRPQAAADADDPADERAAAVLDVARADVGSTDGEKYEDALLAAGGELCYQRGYWCATWVWWAFDQAGQSESFCGGLPLSYPQEQADWHARAGSFHAMPNAEWTLDAGDLAFFLYDDGFPGGERVSHSEIVESYDEERGIVRCISANPVVERHAHSLDDPDLIGFGDIEWK